MKRIDGPTPNGGAYCEIYYYDDNGNRVEEENATKGIINECDENGKVIMDTYFYMEKKEDIDLEDTKELTAIDEESVKVVR